MGIVDKVFSLWRQRSTPLVGGVGEGSLDRWMETSGICGMWLNIRVSLSIQR